MIAEERAVGMMVEKAEVTVIIQLIIEDHPFLPLLADRGKEVYRRAISCNCRIWRHSQKYRMPYNNSSSF